MKLEPLVIAGELVARNANVYPSAELVFTFQVDVPTAEFCVTPSAVLMDTSAGFVIDIPAVTFNVTMTVSDAVAARVNSGSYAI